MAERLAYLEAVVGADITQFRKGMRDIRNEIGFLSESMRGLSALGRTMTFTLTAPLVTMATYTVQAASEFESAMRNVNSIAQLTEGEFAKLSDQVLKFGATTRTGPVGAAEALFTVFGAGITDTSIAMELMSVSSKTAEAGLANLENTTNSIIATFLAYRRSGESTADALDRIRFISDATTAAIAVGVGGMDAFATATAQVMPAANALGMSVEELYGDMAFLTQRGLTWAMASTSMNNALTSLAKPTEALQAAFAELGAKGAEDLIQKFGGVNGAMKALIGTTDGTQQEIQALFNNMRGARAINLFASDIAGWDKAMEDFYAIVDGATDRAWAEQMKSFAASMDLLKSAAFAAAVAIGQQLLPILAPLVQGITDFMLSITELDPRLVQIGVVIAGVVAAAGPLIWIFSSLITPAGLAAGAIAGLAIAFETNFSTIKDTVLDTVKDIVGPEGIGKLESLWAEVTAILFPTEEDPVTTGAFSPIQMQSSDFVTIQAGDTLWDIFQSAYSDQFTWEQFRDNVILPGGKSPIQLAIGDIIEIPTNTGEKIYDQIAASFRPGDNVPSPLPTLYELDPLPTITGLAGMEQTEATNPIAEQLMGRISEAVTHVVNNIGPILQPIVSSITTWFDTQVGEGLTGLASLFQPGTQEGAGPVFQAIRKLLKGDIAGAIDEVIPGLGTKFGELVSGWAAELTSEANKSKIVEGAETLLTNMGTWLETEGVPTVSRSIGYMLGRLSLLLNEGLSTLWSGMTEGDGGAGIASAFEETISGPFSEGFQTAMTEGGMAGGGVDRLFTALESALLGFAITWTLAPGVVTAIAGGIGRGLRVIQFADSIVTPVLTTLGNALFRNALVTTAFNSVAEQISLRILAARVALAPLAGQTIIGTIGGAISGAATQFISGTTGWVVGTASAIVNNIGLAMAGGMASIKFAIAGIASSMWAAILPITLVAAAIAGVALQLQEFQKNVGEAKTAGTEVGEALAQAHPPGTLQGLTPAQIDEILYQDLQNTMQAESGAFLGDLRAKSMWNTVSMINLRAEAKAAYAEAATGATEGFTEKMAADTTAAATASTWIQGIVDQTATDLDSHSPSVVYKNFGKDVVDGFNLGLTENLPLTLEKFNEYIGPEGSIPLAFTEFNTTVGTKGAEIVATLGTMATNGTANIQKLNVGVATAAGSIAANLLKIQTGAEKAAAALNSLAAQIESNQKNGYPTGVGIDGALARGGRYGPGTYLVGENGPELMSTKFGGTMLNNDVLMGGGRAAASSTTYQNNHIELHGVNDPDAILYEFRRRGIVLK